MSIQTKLEEIRNLPESVRIRYLFGSVGISMFFIGLLWIFSLTTSFKEQKIQAPVVQIQAPQEDVKNTETNQDQPTTQQDTTPSLNEWIKK